VLRDKARLFLALWPGPEVRAAMAQYRDTWRWPDKAAQVRAEKLHLTLHFIGDVERRRLPQFQQLYIPFEPFDLKLGYPDLWPHGIAVLRPHRVPTGLIQLQAALGGELQRLAVPVDAGEFRPHVTLARRAREAALLQQQALIDWHVDGYVLVESEFDANRTYTVLARYS
jgi:2'-5' RNA ligase